MYSATVHAKNLVVFVSRQCGHLYLRVVPLTIEYVQAHVRTVDAAYQSIVYSHTFASGNISCFGDFDTFAIADRKVAFIGAANAREGDGLQSYWQGISSCSFKPLGPIATIIWTRDDHPLFGEMTIGVARRSG